MGTVLPARCQTCVFTSRMCALLTSHNHSRTRCHCTDTCDTQLLFWPDCDLLTELRLFISWFSGPSSLLCIRVFPAQPLLSHGRCVIPVFPRTCARGVPVFSLHLCPISLSPSSTLPFRFSVPIFCQASAPCPRSVHDVVHIYPYAHIWMIPVTVLLQRTSWSTLLPIQPSKKTVCGELRPRYPILLPDSTSAFLSCL